MDDQGSTSSWYVMSALGFYPVDTSSPNYILGSPIFDEVTIHMGNGHDLKIIAKNNSDRNAYVQSATLNAKHGTRHISAMPTLWMAVSLF